MAAHDNPYAGKKLLILAGAGVHSKVVDAAREMGIRTIVTDYLPIEESPAKAMADEAWMINITEVGELTARCKAEGIDGVLDFCIDPAQRPAQEIAEACGLPVMGTREQVIALTDKREFKKLCQSAGVDVIPTYSADRIASVGSAYPVLVKPVDSRGSRGITVCETETQLREAIREAAAVSSDGGVIIEKYMAACQDLTISYLVKDGEPILVSLGDRYSGRAEDGLDRQLICTVQPSRYAEMYMRQVNAGVCRMIRQLGIRNGQVFMQGFTDGNKVMMYDPGLRFPGNEYERIFERATGLNLMKSVIGYMVGGEIDDFDGKLDGSYRLNGQAAVQYMINVGPGKIAKFEGLEEIRSLPFVVDVQQRHAVGDVIKPTGDIRHRAGEVSVMVPQDAGAVIRAIDRIHALLRVENEEGQNMLISPFDFRSVSHLYKSVFNEKETV